MHTSHPLYPDYSFHIYNHAVGKENLFRSKSNYHYFLQKYSQHVAPVADTFAYCLMPNHFHLAVRIKSESEIICFLQEKNKANPSKKLTETLSRFQTLRGLELSTALALMVSKQFSNLFNAYAQAYNRQTERWGNLFEQKFKRKPIQDSSYILNLVHYIHHNPVHHGFSESISDWEYSSYHSMLSPKPTRLLRNETIELFGDNNNFKAFHKKDIDDNWFTEFDLN